MAAPGTTDPCGAWLLTLHSRSHLSADVTASSSIIQRKVLSPNAFADLDAVEHRLLAFGERYEQLATPFEWKFTRADLRRLMIRLERSPLVGAAA